MTATATLVTGGRAPERRRPTGPRLITPIVTVIIVGLFAFIPIVWMTLTAFTTQQDIFTFPLSFDRELTLDHFVSVLSNSTLMRFTLNGVLVSTATTLLSLAVGFLAGYAFSKFRFRGRGGLMYLILLAQMVPEVLLLLTLYSSFSDLGLLNTYYALILSYTTFTLPISVLMMKNTFDALPDELLEAARIDGASEARIMLQVLLPLVRTALIAVGLFAFMRAWNDLVYALTLVDTNLQTLPAGLSLTFLGEFQNSYGEMMAASLVTSLPVVVIFLVLQKHFVNGALTGAIK